MSGTPQRHPSSTRHKARKRALDILFEAELRGRSVLDTLAERTDAAEPPVRDYTGEIVRAFSDHAADVDARISAALDKDWSLDRMPLVDRTACRIAVTEMAYLALPIGVAVTEAIAMVEELSTDESPTFVSGVLNNVIID
ncbi:transcription antitermination factor NusB [Raineyella fluvialis]|uniref:Transcription antitermination factor NusB n=1 Tax=Raineyella fluvialis TaxID=2662261 RepID=A0A5Q2FCL1_9ACTN|nr:transcription antitermination factor NusB [Raineyella fluvialis]QGF24529.1 transcription antitermination factor NusB [Raineyella fluvialis]